MKTHETKSKSSIPAGRCKGTLLVNLRSFVTTNRDAGAWERLVTSLPKSDRDVLYQPLLPSSWYPIGVWNRALRTHVRSASDQAAEIKRFARYVADRDLNTVMKFALSIAMPDTIVARTGMFWSRYFDSGKVFPRMVKPFEQLAGRHGADVQVLQQTEADEVGFTRVAEDAGHCCVRPHDGALGVEQHDAVRDQLQ